MVGRGQGIQINIWSYVYPCELYYLHHVRSCCCGAAGATHGNRSSCVAALGDNGDSGVLSKLMATLCSIATAVSSYRVIVAMVYLCLSLALQLSWMRSVLVSAVAMMSQVLLMDRDKRHTAFLAGLLGVQSASIPEERSLMTQFTQEPDVANS